MSGSDAVGRQRQALIAARDQRAATIAAHAARLRSSGASAVLALALNLPGPDKAVAGARELARRALRAARGAFPCAVSGAFGSDALGPFHLLLVPEAAGAAKRAAVALEEALPGGRLIDFDVYDASGAQIGRRDIGASPRSCLLCGEPAADCIRGRRHDRASLDAAVAAQLAAAASGSVDRDDAAGACTPEAVAASLVAGAMAELRLTPKPGLVDLADSGSHPDLSFEKMRRSVGLMDGYLARLIASTRGGATLDEQVRIGVRAEERMFAEVGANAHKGYIFLSGLLVLAAAYLDPPCAGSDVKAIGLDRLRRGATGLAQSLFSARPTDRGIARETTSGLPSLFDVGLPALSSGLARFSDAQRASHLLLARLMQVADDTTALHRCGPAGLERIRADGARLEAVIEQGGDGLAMLARANDEYRAMRLTMGGVADLVAATMGLYFLLEPAHPFCAADGPAPSCESGPRRA